MSKVKKELLIVRTTFDKNEFLYLETLRKMLRLKSFQEVLIYCYKEIINNPVKMKMIEKSFNIKNEIEDKAEPELTDAELFKKMRKWQEEKHNN